jgi:hypothetical protein
MRADMSQLVKRSATFWKIGLILGGVRDCVFETASRPVLGVT